MGLLFNILLAPVLGPLLPFLIIARLFLTLAFLPITLLFLPVLIPFWIAKCVGAAAAADACRLGRPALLGPVWGWGVSWAFDWPEEAGKKPGKNARLAMRHPSCVCPCRVPV